MSRSWQKIGEVTGTDKPKAGEKVNYEGKQWDYVFDVAIEDGAPALKLPYNVSGMHPNPLFSCDYFLTMSCRYEQRTHTRLLIASWNGTACP